MLPSARRLIEIAGLGPAYPSLEDALSVAVAIVSERRQHRDSAM